MVRELKTLEYKKAKEEYSITMGSEPTEQMRLENAYRGDGVIWVFENDLFETMSGGRFLLVHDLKKILQSCITDGFILTKQNPDYAAYLNCYPSEGIRIRISEDTSHRMVRVSEGEGERILNRRYFWLHYIANTLPPIANIFISIITALLTSSIIWFFIWNIVSSKLNSWQMQGMNLPPSLSAP